MGWGTQPLRPLGAYHDFIERNLCLNRGAELPRPQSQHRHGCFTRFDYMSVPTCALLNDLAAMKCKQNLVFISANSNHPQRSSVLKGTKRENKI